MKLGEILSRLDKELVIQEAVYGFIMALTFITAELVGIVHWNSSDRLIKAIVCMDFVWAAIDMYIFYVCDVLAHRRRMRMMERMYQTGEFDRAVLSEELECSVLDFVDDETHEKILDDIGRSHMREIEKTRAPMHHYLFNAVTAFIVAFATVIPAVLCLEFIADYHDAMQASIMVSLVALFFTGYFMAPSDDGRSREITGVTTALAAALLTIFAAYLGG